MMSKMKWALALCLLAALSAAAASPAVRAITVDRSIRVDGQETDALLPLPAGSVCRAEVLMG